MLVGTSGVRLAPLQCQVLGLGASPDLSSGLQDLSVSVSGTTPSHKPVQRREGSRVLWGAKELWQSLAQRKESFSEIHRNIRLPLNVSFTRIGFIPTPSPQSEASPTFPRSKLSPKYLNRILCLLCYIELVHMHAFAGGDHRRCEEEEVWCGNVSGNFVNSACHS